MKGCRNIAVPVEYEEDGLDHALNASTVYYVCRHKSYDIDRYDIEGMPGFRAQPCDTPTGTPEPCCLPLPPCLLVCSYSSGVPTCLSPVRRRWHATSACRRS